MNLGPKQMLLVALAAVSLFYIVVVARAVIRARREQPGAATPTGLALGTGFVTNFFDTLGIGSYATTTAIFRQFRMVRDELIPGTLNVGHTLPAVTQAFIFTQTVPVETTTLVLMILAAVAGAWIGAGIVTGWPRRKIQIGMGSALLVAAVIMFTRTAFGDPEGSSALGLSGALLAAGLVGNFMLGAFMMLGIGLYAPCMILVSFLGLNPVTAFPIMMGSCAFLMPVATARFVKERKFDVKVAMGLLLGGIPAALIAALIVKSLPLTVVKYLVVVVVIYAALGLLRTAQREKADAMNNKAAGA
jgi:uncharacterized membrane protein YfcA